MQQHLLSHCRYDLNLPQRVYEIANYVQTISQKLGGTGLQAFWSGTGYLLCGAVFQPVIGGISTLFGRVYILGGSIILFLVGCLTSALAQDFDTMLIGRAIQGIGGGGVVVMSEVLVCDMIPLRQRGQWFGMLSGMYAIGTVLGPVFGGLFAQHVTWVRTTTNSH